MIRECIWQNTAIANAHIMLTSERPDKEETKSEYEMEDDTFCSPGNSK